MFTFCPFPQGGEAFPSVSLRTQKKDGTFCFVAKSELTRLLKMSHFFAFLPYSLTFLYGYKRGRAKGEISDDEPKVFYYVILGAYLKKKKNNCELSQ